MVVPLYKAKRERSECKNSRNIHLLSMVGIIYAGILVRRICRVTEGLIDDEQEGFRAGRRCVD